MRLYMYFLLLLIGALSSIFLVIHYRMCIVMFLDALCSKLHCLAITPPLFLHHHQVAITSSGKLQFNVMQLNELINYVK